MTQGMHDDDDDGAKRDVYYTILRKMTRQQYVYWPLARYFTILPLRP